MVIPQPNIFWHLSLPNQDLTVVGDAINTVTRLLQMPNTSEYGLLILEHVSKKHMELLNKSEICDTLHALLLDIDDVARITAVEGLQILGWL
ncbi:hypothetical protein BYT27DRAFT_7182583 [Phlegmacium glaucopus]|nr:hypothetical protein BYT27DRAFT_7182583 [Phlegmacium glaucopus]